MLKGMAKNPIIFAMANPDPEIRPEAARAVRKDAIIATGRSDYPNQVNNVMGFPYIFRGALDVRASEINDEMKIAAAEALAMLAREEVPDEVSAAYSGRKMEFGPEYIIPTPFDPRLMSTIPVAVAKAAVRTGVARKPIKNWDGYKMQLAARRDPTANRMNMLFEKLKTNPQRMIFAEGEDERIIRAAVQWRDNGYGTPILVGRTDQVKEHMKKMGIKDTKGIEITNASVVKNLEPLIDNAYKRLQRHGFLRRDCARGVKNDRNIFAASLLAHGDGDAMITGATRNYNVCVQDVARIIPQKKDSLLFGLTVMIAKGKTVFLADTTIHELPSSEELCQIAIKAAEKARQMGHEPRVAFLSFSNFGNPMREKATRIREAVKLMDGMRVDFEYEGEMSADVALNKDLMALYPFCRLSGPANVLVMPALHSAHVASKMLQELGDGVTIGPIMMGLEKPVQIVQMNSSVADIMNLAAIAAVDAMKTKAKPATKATAKAASAKAKKRA
jgi:malate dehydrogenase (oxaloacetate-decarboxylating)(NADP+)